MGTERTGPMAMTARRDDRSLLAAIVTLCALGSPAEAQIWSLGADAGLGETDNVTLASSDKVSQTMAIADVDFAVLEQSRLFNVNLKGDFSDYDYLQHAYGNELIGRFDGVAKMALVPDRLTWVLQEDFGQSLLDPYTPQTPSNRQNVNYVSTGPDVD